MAEYLKRFLLGKGEDLTTPANRSSSGGSKVHPNSWGEGIKYIGPQIYKTAKYFDGLPEAACPNDHAVALFLLHPAYTAMSFFPKQLFDDNRFWAIGSRSARIKPRNDIRKKGNGEELFAIALYIAGQRRVFRDLASNLQQEHKALQEEWIRIERVSGVSPSDRIKKGQLRNDLWEVVLHAPEEADFIGEGFSRYLKDLDITMPQRRQSQIGGLRFVPLQFKEEMVTKVAQFSFVRAIRPMPSLRPIDMPTVLRSFPTSPKAKLPDADALSTSTRVAILDGGLVEHHGFDRWVNHHDATGGTEAHEKGLEHGQAVTSAVLFGHVESGHTLPAPYFKVGHHRILGIENGGDVNDVELPDILQRIRQTILEGNYRFANLSLGPCLSADDDDVHMWTATLDQLLAGGHRLITVAVGNNGAEDQDSGNARIQVPADSVNALSVGSCDRQDTGWSRAPYSAIGPGRDPGIVKPDVLAFGGHEPKRPFCVVDSRGDICGTQGTSFAAPYALRMAAGIDATMGDQLNPLAIRCLLINNCRNPKKHPVREVGWGKLPDELESLVTCGDGEVRILYQNTLGVGETIKAPVPLPACDLLKSPITITATFCYACSVDPEDAPNYTKSGLEITFRPDKDRLMIVDENEGDAPSSGGTIASPSKERKPQTQSFFPTATYQSESALRFQFHKWDTVRHASKTFKKNRAGIVTLNDPYFEIHHLLRSHGRNASRSSRARPIPYALVLHIHSPKMETIYDQVVTRYRRLQPLTPIQIPVQTEV